MLVIGSSFRLLENMLQQEIELLWEELLPHPETVLRANISGKAKEAAPPPKHANTLSTSGVKAYPPFVVNVDNNYNATKFYGNIKILFSR